jgi:hypothetical protein
LRNKHFDVDLFLSRHYKQKYKIETKHISHWLECSIRLVQKWCKNNNIEYYRIHGIKYYKWNKSTIKKFGEWYNNKNIKKPRKNYYIHKPSKPKLPPKPKKDKSLPFTTVKEIHKELNISFDIRYLQLWCKKSRVPFEYHFGRKYYKITDDVKSEIIKTFVIEMKNSSYISYNPMIRKFS